jgi:clan AA aspartic protease
MIEGCVSSREAIIRLVVSAPDGGNETELEAIVDTGFDRSLTLPPGIIADLNLTPRGETPIILADGSEQRANFYGVVVVWNEHARPVIVEEADTMPLVGMELLANFQLRIDCVENGSVEIEKL